MRGLVIMGAVAMLSACGGPAADQEVWFAERVAGTERGVADAVISSDGARIDLLFLSADGVHAGRVPLKGAPKLEDLGVVSFPWPRSPGAMSLPADAFDLAARPGTSEVWVAVAGAVFKLDGAMATRMFSDPAAPIVGSPASALTFDSSGSTVYFDTGTARLSRASLQADGTLGAVQPLKTSTNASQDACALGTVGEVIWGWTCPASAEGSLEMFRWTEANGIQSAGLQRTVPALRWVTGTLGLALRGGRAVTVGGFIEKATDVPMTEAEVAAFQKQRDYGFNPIPFLDSRVWRTDLHPTDDLYTLAYGPADVNDQNSNAGGLVVVSRARPETANDRLEGTWCRHDQGVTSVGFRIASGKYSELFRSSDPVLATDDFEKKTASFGGGDLRIDFTQNTLVPELKEHLNFHYKLVGDTLNLQRNHKALDDRDGFRNLASPTVGLYYRHAGEKCD